jgi:hypothetical protein
MVREFRADAAEVRPEEPAQTPTTKTAAAKSVGVKAFISQSLVFKRGMGRDPGAPKFRVRRITEALAVDTQALSGTAIRVRYRLPGFAVRNV